MSQNIRSIDFNSRMTVEQHLQNIEANPELKLELNSYLLIDPEKEMKKAEFYATFWKVVAITAAIGFITISFAGLTFLGLTNPELLPYVLMGIGSFYMPLIYVYKYFKDKSIYYEQRAIIERETLNQVRHLETLSNTALMLKLYEINPRWNQSMEARRLLSKVDSAYFRAYIPLLARHEYWKNAAVNANREARHYFEQARALRQGNNLRDSRLSSENKELLIKNFRKEAFKKQEESEALNRIKAAFLIYVLQHPLNERQADSEDRKRVDIYSFGKPQLLSYTQRQMRKQYETIEEEKDPYFIKHDGHKVGRDWILNHSYQEIAQICFS